MKCDELRQALALGALGALTGCVGAVVAVATPISLLVSAANNAGYSDAALEHRHRCARESMPDCIALARMHYTGDGAPRDPPRAEAFYLRTCDAGYVPGCVELARVLLARGAPRDATRAFELARHGCDRGDAPACALLGDLYRRGEGHPRDEAQATRVLTVACEGGELEECEQVERDCEARGGDRDAERRVAAAFERACGQGVAPACFQLGALHVDGRGVARDEARASELFNRACAQGVEGACEGRDALAGQRAATVDGGVAADGSGLPAAVIRYVILRRISAVGRCYRAAAVAHPAASGRLVMHFEVGANGAVTTARLTEDTLGIADVASCAVATFGRLRFPAPRDGGVVTVDYPMSFGP